MGNNRDMFLCTQLSHGSKQISVEERLSGPSRDAGKRLAKKDRRRCFIYISYAFQPIILWSANRKGEDIFQSIKKAPDFFLFFLSILHSCLTSSVHFEMNKGNFSPC